MASCHQAAWRTLHDEYFWMEGNHLGKGNDREYAEKLFELMNAFGISSNTPYISHEEWAVRDAGGIIGYGGTNPDGSRRSMAQDDVDRARAYAAGVETDRARARQNQTNNMIANALSGINGGSLASVGGKPKPWRTLGSRIFGDKNSRVCHFKNNGGDHYRQRGWIDGFSAGVRWQNIVILDIRIGNPRTKPNDGDFPGRDGKRTEGFSMFYTIDPNSNAGYGDTGTHKHRGIRWAAWNCFDPWLTESHP